MIIILMQSRGSDSQAAVMDTIEPLPEKQQWALINKYKALEFERMKAKEREIDRIKKSQFRHQLDQQVNSQSNQEQKIKQQDRAYYQRLSENAEEQRRREEHEKADKYMKRRTIESENQYKVELQKHSRVKSKDTGYHLDIGVASEQEHKNKSQVFRREMMDTLDVQLRQKEIETKRAKEMNRQIQRQHLAQQGDYFKPEERKMYLQNQKVYDYYKGVYDRKEQVEKEIEHRFVDEAIERNHRAEDERQRQEEHKRAVQKQVVKQALDSQVQDHQRKKRVESQFNPEEVSYGFISNMFREKEQRFDKDEYKKELKRQAEEHKRKKTLENHMSPEEYKININQLSKIVGGGYGQDKYLDRSMGAIGDHQKYELESVNKDLRDRDADVVRHRLETMRHQNRSFIQ